MGPGKLRDAAAALRYWELRQQVATNNLANAETPGFKAERAFARLLDDATVSIGAETDLRAGALRPTGGPLDLALTSDTSFYVVRTPEGERLTRGGAMRLDEQRRIVNEAGHPLLAKDGPVIVPEGATIAIEKDGQVRAGDVVVGTLRVESVTDPASLTHEAAGLWRTSAATKAVEGADRGVRQGVLEASNTSTLDSMIELITIQRAYGAVQGGIRTLDGVLDTIANRIGRLG